MSFIKGWIKIVILFSIFIFCAMWSRSFEHGVIDLSNLEHGVIDMLNLEHVVLDRSNLEHGVIDL